MYPRNLARPQMMWGLRDRAPTPEESTPSPYESSPEPEDQDTGKRCSAATRWVFPTTARAEDMYPFPDGLPHANFLGAIRPGPFRDPEPLELKPAPLRPRWRKNTPDYFLELYKQKEKVRKLREKEEEQEKRRQETPEQKAERRRIEKKTKEKKKKSKLTPEQQRLQDAVEKMARGQAITLKPGEDHYWIYKARHPYWN